MDLCVLPSSNVESGISQSSLIGQWTNNDGCFYSKPSQLDIDDELLSAVDDSPELASFDISEMNAPLSGRQGTIPMFGLVDAPSPTPIIMCQQDTFVPTESNSFSLLNRGEELDSSLMSTVTTSNELQLEASSLHQLLHPVDSVIKSEPQEMMQLSADYFAKLLMPTAFEHPTAPAIMTPAVQGPISSASVGCSSILPSLSKYDTPSFHFPPLTFANSLPSPDSLPSTPHVEQALPPLSTILPCDYSCQLYSTLSSKPSCSVSRSASRKSKKSSEMKRKRLETTGLYSKLYGDSLLRKKSKGGGRRSGQMKFKKTDNQLAILRTYFSLNKMPSREGIMKLGEITGLTFQEVRNWFRNARLRYKEPLTATCDISILKDVPGIPEHVFQQHCNTESVNNLVSQAYVTSYSPAPKKRKAETSTINCTTTKTEEGTRRSERIRTGWRSAAMMAALLEAEKYQPNKARVGSPDRDCFSCVNVLQSATHNCNTCSSVPEIVVTQDELEKSLQFGQPKQSNLQQRADNNSYSNGSDSAGLLLPCGEVASGQLTPPTTPSTKSADFIDGVLSSSKLTTHKDVSTTCQQISQEEFDVVKDRFVKSFTHHPPESKERKELLRALVQELDVREKASLHVMVSARLTQSTSNDSMYHINMKDRARDAWENLQDLFKRKNTNGTYQTNLDSQSVYLRGAESTDVSLALQSRMDEDMFEGLKGMFQARLDYLHAVWKQKNSVGSTTRHGLRKSSVCTDSDDSIEGKVSDLDERVN